MAIPQKVTWENVLASLEGKHILWRNFFDDRQLKEIQFSALYAAQFAHGTDGHNSKLIVARMAELLDLIAESITIETENE